MRMCRRLLANPGPWLLLLASAVALSPPAAAQRPQNVSGGPLRPDEACYDVRGYTLRITVDPAKKAISGDLTMRADVTAATKELSLDLDQALTVHAVQLQGADVPFRHEGGRILLGTDAPLAVGSPLEVRVVYGGVPREALNPPWDGGFTWKQTPDGKPWIATTCQGEGGDLWWPCKDHPSDKPDTFDLYCKVPDGLVVASNGTLQGDPVEQTGWRTFHWRSAEPIANYNVALNIAPYVELRDTFTCIDGTEMPIQFFVLPESVERAKRCLPQFLDHIRVFEQLLGPYPFRAEKYGIAETPHLGMEHQTIIAYGNGFRDEQYDWLHNHELSHEWWGNLVTCPSWEDMWLHEGFGTYMQPLYRELRFGREAYDKEIHSHRLMNRRAIAPREVMDSKQIYFGGGGNDIYYKGSLVLHTLRWQMGDEKFFAALRRFAYPSEAATGATDGSQVRFATTDEFVALCSEIAGEELAWFFEVYVRRAGLPRLRSAVQDGVLTLRWETPDDLPFALAVPVQLDGVVVVVPMAGGRGQLEVGEKPYVIDPQQRILMLQKTE
ncbi:MAG: M1 family metallopeptidase [Planctomycetes bacterium]|nr:M1 family metallopeptidase [Planctomycetota bacterium]